MSNELENKIKDAIDYAFDEKKISELSSLVADVAVKFNEWRVEIFNKTTHLSHPYFWQEIDKHSWKLKPAKDSYNHFINNIYGKQ